MEAGQIELIVGFVVSLLAAIFAFSKWILNWANKKETNYRVWVDDHQSKEQLFIDQQDEKWRKWMEKQNKSSCRSLDMVARNLTSLQESQKEGHQAFLKALEEHDARAESYVHQAVEKVSEVARNALNDNKAKG